VAERIATRRRSLTASDTPSSSSAAAAVSLRQSNPVLSRRELRLHESLRMAAARHATKEQVKRRIKIMAQLSALADVDAETVATALARIEANSYYSQVGDCGHPNIIFTRHCRHIALFTSILNRSLVQCITIIICAYRMVGCFTASEKRPSNFLTTLCVASQIFKHFILDCHSQ
jgi:hypothetical protein